MQVEKLGKRLAVRLPTNVVEALELHEGDDIEIVVDTPRKSAVRKKPKAVELRDRLLRFERLRRFRGKLPADFKFNRDQANGRG
ncbi:MULTISPECIES: AbrB/MazE/SpoVT family DNA-binding domain-containing protein [Pseudomonas]|uniref:AbrB/MazE/SpoVT family DNA-binding domain-containing protein n=1 Tax=Pseudomonas TaxID=286 RepID=UPI0023603F44|nr:MULTISPECIES: AbrB/MazE/SpoVT family DNA-binding domain-containing protein [Pseudomonas]WJV25588.1 AbrB/MazE/SpoVT family DNA-binding domain-containing protein [Pseudomonas chlororaphis]